MWWHDARFYHIHPISYFDAPARNDFSSPAVNRIELLRETAADIKRTGCNAIYLGPVFESTSHGYDTVDYYHVDRRLGSNETLKSIIGFLHDSGMRVILDGVYNHAGRDFWAFYDVKMKREASSYKNWFRGLDFRRDNRFGDGFSYEGWEGHDSLVSLDLANPAVREHLFGAIRWMVEELSIDGLRLDVAYMLDPDFIAELRRVCTSMRDDLFLLGEMIHGDYTRIVGPALLDSATNYEAQKGLWSAHNDHNYFEIAYSLNREFGAEGLYRGIPLYSFADNHDVNRVASQLQRPEDLFPLYTILYMMPGIPSIYYGSEWGERGTRTKSSDHALRPAWKEVVRSMPELRDYIGKLARVRSENGWLAVGEYRQLHVSAEQYVFLRSGEGRRLVVGVNMADRENRVSIEVADVQRLRSCFDSRSTTVSPGGRVEIGIPAHGAELLVAD
ncbi:MAG TPA: alpha-amylase family glycosyl hydrolase [Spirochaetia bacterium]|nr:alpha-amylase family glycosyl hydrolase [Spirochaetia bacterium]